MTINSSVRSAGPYLGNGSQTAWPFSFKVFTADDLTVFVTDTNGSESKISLNGDYTVTLNADQDAAPGGSVTYALPSGYKLTITSEIDATQQVDIANLGGFYPKIITQALDKLTVLVQQSSSVGARSLSFPISDGIPSIELPSARARAGNVLSFDESGLPVVSAPASGSAAELAITLADKTNAEKGAGAVGFSGGTVRDALALHGEGIAELIETKFNVLLSSDVGDLSSTAVEPSRLLFLGDSLTEGSTNTLTPSITYAKWVRAAAKKVLGDSGRGFVSPGNGRLEGFAVGSSAGITEMVNTALGSYPTRYSFDGLGYFAASGSGSDYIEFYFADEFDYSDLYYLQDTAAGSFVVNGQAVNCAGTLAIKKIRLAPYLVGSNRRVNVDNITGAVAIFGVRNGYNSKTGSTGTINAKGGRSLSGGFDLLDATMQAWWISELSPSHVFINFGTNDAGTSTPAAFGTSLQALVQRYIDNSTATIFVIEPNRPSDYTTYNSGAYVAITQKRKDVVAYFNSDRVKYVDLPAILGDYTQVNNAKMMRDGVHPNTSGHKTIARGIAQYVLGIGLSGDCDGLSYFQYPIDTAVYVNQSTGNDSGAGTSSSPIKSLHRAAEMLNGKPGLIKLQADYTHAEQFVWNGDSLEIDTNGHTLTSAEFSTTNGSGVTQYLFGNFLIDGHITLTGSYVIPAQTRSDTYPGFCFVNFVHAAAEIEYDGKYASTGWGCCRRNSGLTLNCSVTLNTTGASPRGLVGGYVASKGSPFNFAMPSSATITTTATAFIKLDNVCASLVFGPGVPVTGSWLGGVVKNGTRPVNIISNVDFTS